MADLNTCTGLLVGRELVSKSHPGTQATPTDVAQGPGCPSYSGGGKDPLNPTDTTTPASPLDLTSLAAAIPGHAPAPASAWTLVEPKKRKEKIKKQTDRQTGKGHDKKQTDRLKQDKDKQTDKIGKGGGKLEDSDPPTTSTGGSAEASKGGNEGKRERPLDDTATPGCSTDEHGDGGRPGTGRDPHASGVSSNNTAGAGQTVAKDRANNGGHNDPRVNPIRAQGATGLGGHNIARPPTTKTTKTTTNTQPISQTTKDPNIPSSRPHPRRRNRNRGGAKTQTSPQGTVASSSGLPAKKRDRLDDTISPRGEHKRARTDHRQTRVATDSYAKAAQSHLCVAVTTTPRSDLTQAEADNIQGQIQKAIFAACIEPLAPGQTRYAPAFEGKAFLGDGVLKMWCHDDRALSWLKTKITTIASPRSGTALTVICQTEIPEKVRSGLFVPNYDGDIGLLHQVLSHQNPWYGVAQWTLFSYQKTTSNPSGMFLILGIPKGELPTILARGRKVAYSTGSIYIRFFTAGGLSDVPPGHGSDPEVRGGSGVEERMELDEPTDQGDETPEPSVSTVLNNIEEVLSEARADPNTAATNTAPAEQTSARRAPQL